MYPLKKLSEICKILKGKNPNLFPSFKDGSKPYLSAKYIRGTQLPEYALEADSKSILVEKDDIVIICDGSNSGESFSGIEGILSSTMGKVLLKDEIDRKYLKFFLDLIIEELRGKKTGTAIPHLDIKGLLGYNISLPPLSTQLDIVAHLDSAMAEIETLRNETESALASIREIWESTLGSVFASGGKDWEEKTLNEIIKIKHGFAFKSEYFSFEGNYVLLTPGNFYEKGGYRERGEKQKYYMGDFPESYILVEGDLLVAMTEQAPGLLGSPILIPEGDKFLHNQRLGLIGFIGERKLQNEFLFHFFNTKFVRREIHDSASGTKVRHTSPEKIGKVRISFPSLSEQSRIVAHLDAVRSKTERLEILYREKLASLDELKRSVLAEAFL